jgi:tripartite-type tricarboxylate transporter receptor subunit TctC
VIRRDATLLMALAFVLPGPLHAQQAPSSSKEPVASAAKSPAPGYPTRPVRVVSPYPPGSSADVIGRIYSPKFTEALGRQFIVDNRPGASGNIAGEIVARAAPDGYTLLLLNTPLASSPLLFKHLPFDVVKDFQPAGMLGLAPYLLAVSNALPVTSTKELVALAQARPKKLTYASTGTGGGLHLTMEMFKMMTGTDMLHVPYKGSGTVVTDMLGGQIDVAFVSVPALLPHIKAGRVRGLAVSSAKRSAAVPDLPTVNESGVPGFESVSFTSLAGPSGMPRNITAVLNATIAKAAQSQEVMKALAAQGTDPVIMTPEQVAAHVRSEIVKWKKVVTAAGVHAE